MLSPFAQSTRYARRSFPILATLGGAAVFFVYEASKSAVFPGLTIWESHWITIAFGAGIVGTASWIALRRQERLLHAIAAEAARREGLELRQRALQESEARFRLLVEQSPEAIVVHRADSVIYVNPACAALIGAPDTTALVGLRLSAVVHDDDRDLLYRRRGFSEHQAVRIRRHDGSFRDVEVTSVETDFGGAAAMQSILRDVTEQRRLESRLLHQAFHDSLTGLANRALFRDRVEHMLEQRRSSTAVNAVVFLDLDDFKRINDQFGHEAGDLVLRTMADRLRRETRSSDTVARLGGDEFAVLLERLPSEREGLVIVNRIRMALSEPLSHEPRALVLSASLGIAFARPDDSPESILRHADVAMYAAKDSGKARHAIFEPAMYDAVLQRLRLETDLRAALGAPADAGLSLVFQPIVELESRAVRSLEALLRWNHPELGPVSPAEFIPVAEQSGAIVALGWWVLEHVCLQIAEWRTAWWLARRAMGEFPTVSVNISGHQLDDEHFADRLQELLERTGVKAEHLILEITETVIMRDTERVLGTLRTLRGLGVRLAIDDFGTGYSSLSYLQRFPVDVLKIDRAFIEGMPFTGSEAALARTIVTLGGTLGLRTVAEGVETDAQRRALVAMGCELGQGFLFARPLTVEAVTDFLESCATGTPLAPMRHVS